LFLDSMQDKGSVKGSLRVPCGLVSYYKIWSQFHFFVFTQRTRKTTILCNSEAKWLPGTALFRAICRYI
jgi:hypothetical protein